MKVFFTGDLHFGHENIIGFDNRPFSSVEQMNDELIRRWNAKVGTGDLVYVLGDMFWRADNCEKIIKRLNGRIILIKGNHDGFVKSRNARKLLEDVKDYDDIRVTLGDGRVKRCILSHYFIPFYDGYRRGAIHLHGHSHFRSEARDEEAILQNLAEKGYTLKVYNAGCMYWNYEPVTLDEILKKHDTYGGVPDWNDPDGENE